MVIIEQIFRHILEWSLMGTLSILLVLGIKLILGKRASARWHYSVWLLVIIRLLIPVAPEHDISIYNLATNLVYEIKGADVPDNGIAPGSEIFHNSGGEQEPLMRDIPNTQVRLPEHTPQNNTVKKTLSPMLIPAWIWVLGMGLTALLILMSNIKFSRRIRQSIPCKEPSDLKIIEECKKIISVKKSIPLLLNEDIRVPLLYGALKPRLLISGSVLDKLSPNEKKYVFLHELIHYRRMDIVVNWIAAFLRCVYWFNPLIHYAFYKMREDCEVSCDESVLKKLKPAEYMKYGRTIISLIEMLSGTNTLTCTSSLIQKKSGVKRRISMISNFKQKTVMATIITMILTVLVGCSALTGAKSGNIEPPISNNDAPSASTPVNSTEPSAGQTQENPEPDSADESSSENLQAENNKDGIVPGEAGGPAPEDMTVDEKVELYLDKLKDKDYTSTYGHGYTWYIAAEELGMIGKPAIPGLIEKLDTKDDYERTLALYALLLASQHDNVKVFTNGEYIQVNLDFDPATHPAMVETAKAWWNKYKDNF